MTALRIAAVLALLAWCGVARADPVSILVAAAQALGTIAGAGWIVVGATIFGTVDARRKAKRAAARARAEYNAGLSDRQVTALQADPFWRVVYGRQVGGGDIVAMFTSDKTATRTDGTTYTKPDAYKHLVIVVAAHEVAAINEIYIDGVPLGALDGNGWVTGGEFATSSTQTREITIAAGASSTQPAAVTVLSAWDETLSSTSGTGVALIAGSYTLTSGNTVINNTGANPIRVTFTMSVAQPTVRVQKHLGSPTQTADAFLTSTVPTEWGSADRLQGLAYVVMTLDLENQRFQGAPPNPTFDVTGRLVLDTRTGVTAWSENPALIVRDFLTAEWGFNCTADDIDVAACNAAANACDVPITLTIGSTATPGQPTYTCNGSFTTGDSREAVLDDLCESMAGFATYGAQWVIQAGAWTAPVMTLTDDDLDGQIEIVQGSAGMDEIFNTVRGSYVPAQSSVVSDFDVYQNAAFLAADGQVLATDITLPFTNNKARCRNLARIFTELNRDSQVIRYPAKLQAFPLQVGDRVTVTSTEYGFAAKTYRVTDWQFGIAAPVTLTLQEDAAANYDLADAASSDPNANTLLPNPWVVSALAGLSAVSGTANQIRLEDGSVQQRVRVSWTAIADAYITDGSGFVVIQWRRQLRDTANVWNTLRVPAYETQAFITGAALNDTITITAWAENAQGVRGSAATVSHTVTGTAQLVTTTMLDPQSATRITPDFYDFAGTAFTESTVRTVTITPPVDCTIEVTASLMAAGLLGDSGWQAYWSVQPTAGGTQTTVASFGSASTSKAMFNAHGVYAATGGVSIDFDLVLNDVPGTAHVFTLWESSIRITEVYR